MPRARIDSSDAPTRPLRADTFLLVAMAVVAVLLGLYVANGHPAGTYDTGHYFSSAVNLASGRGLVSSLTSLAENTLTQQLKRWPPLYPIAWAALLLLGLKGLAAGGAVSALAFGATVAGTGVLGRRLGGPVAGIIAAFFALTSLAFWSMSASALSDMPYTAFAVWSLCFLTADAERPDIRWLAASAACVAAASLTRWVGFTLALSGGLWLALDAVRSRSLRRFGVAVGYGLASAAPLVLYEIVNPMWRPPGGLSPSPGQAPFGVNLAQYLTAVSGDLGLGLARGASAVTAAAWAGRWSVLVLAVVAVAVGVVRFVRTAATDFPELALPGVIALVTYVLVVCYVRSRQYVPAFVTRYVAPFYPVVFAVAAAALVWAARGVLRAVAHGESAGTVAAVAVTCAGLLLTLSVPRLAELRREGILMREGMELAAPMWREDPAFAVVTAAKPNVVISPIASFVYTLTGVPGKSLGGGTPAGNLLTAVSRPPLAGLKVLIVVNSPDQLYQRKIIDVVGLLDTNRFAVLYHSKSELVVRPR